MHKIKPCLWFDNEAEEAARLYTSIFKNSRIGERAEYGESGAEVSGQKKGSVMTVDFEIEGLEFLALNGGPHYKFSPGVSLTATFETLQEIEKAWTKLSTGGKVLMEFQEYPWSKKYGWCEDQFGVSWQLTLSPGEKLKIKPSLLFTGKNLGQANEALNFYASLFKNSKVITTVPYEPGEDKDAPKGSIKYGVCALDGYELIAMDSGYAHQFGITGAISFIVNCKTQDEVDHFWDKLSSDGDQMPCGWVSDKWGVHWQIVPTVLGELMTLPDPKKQEKVMKAMLQMKKLDIAKLKEAAL